MHPSLLLADEETITVPISLLTDKERDRIMKRGPVRLGVTFPTIWVCGNCGRQVTEEALCPMCKTMFENRRRQEEDHGQRLRMAVITVCIVALGCLIAWILNGPAHK